MQERRRFYRIDDELSLQYKVVQGSGTDEEINKARRNYGELVDLRNSLHCVDARMDLICSRLEKDNPALVELVGLINKKIAIYEKLLSSTEFDSDVVSPAREVNLSASGVAFNAETPLKQGTLIKLEMVLYPEHHYIPVFAKVVSCKAHKNNKKSGFNIAVDFDGISEEDQEKIINHIFKKQADELRQRRQSPQVGTESASTA